MNTKISAVIILTLLIGFIFVSTVAAFPTGTSEVTAKGVARIRLEDGRVMPIRGIMTIDFAYEHPFKNGPVTYGMIMMESAEGDKADRIIWQFNPETDVKCTETKKGLVTTINAHAVYCPYHADGDKDILGLITIQYIHDMPIIRASGENIEFVGNIVSFA